MKFFRKNLFYLVNHVNLIPNVCRISKNFRACCLIIRVAISASDAGSLFYIDLMSSSSQLRDRRRYCRDSVFTFLNLFYNCLLYTSDAADDS